METNCVKEAASQVAGSTETRWQTGALKIQRILQEVRKNGENYAKWVDRKETAGCKS